MKNINFWLEEYARDHQHPVNQMLHIVCVPLIVLSLLALLWSIPVPRSLADVSPWLNWGTLVVVAALAYYLALSRTLCVGMAPLLLVACMITAWMSGLAVPLWIIGLSVFVAAWIGQFVGHMVEGRRPAFFRDIQFLMIGPLWILAKAYRRLGISY